MATRPIEQWQKDLAEQTYGAIALQIQHAIKPLEDRIKVLEAILLPLMRNLEAAGGKMNNFPGGLEVKPKQP